MTRELVMLRLARRSVHHGSDVTRERNSGISRTMLYFVVLLQRIGPDRLLAVAMIGTATRKGSPDICNPMDKL